MLTMSNSAGEYHLACNTKRRGCETPEPGKNYLLFSKRTRWKYPNAEGYIDLAFIEDWTGTYTQSENVGLAPQDNQAPGFAMGIYILESFNASKAQ